MLTTQFKTQLNRLCLAIIVVNLCFIVGCHRSYYRRQADAETQRLVRQKAIDPRWNTADGSIEVDPQSRMFNPFSQDHPPIPPDDATSHQLMYSVDGKEGYPHWHANGDTDAVENPEWRAYLPVNEKGQVVLTLERAYQLALLHSPQYQIQRETLYRSALAVSLERFGFDSQLFSGFNSFLTTQGRFRGGGSSNTILQSQIGANGGGANLRRLGVTGTNFAVGLANTILFNFAGNNTQSANSLIDFSVVQPLLRGAGRERIMESLTQSERTLLANIRQLERFKRGFYLNIAIGRNAGAGPNLGGNFLNNPGFAGQNAGGFFGLLQTQQLIRNQEINVRQLESVLKQFREFFDNDRLDAVQLKRFEGGFYVQQRSLLQFRVNYQNQLDAFKVQLGLPPDLDVVIDDSILEQFKLISDQVNDRLIEIVRLREAIGEILDEINSLYQKVDEPNFVYPTNVVESIEKLSPLLERAGTTLESIVQKDVKQLEADIAKLEAIRPKRLAYLREVKREIDAGRIESDVDPGVFESKSITEPDKVRQELYGDNQPVPEGAPPRGIIPRTKLLAKKLDSILEKIGNIKEVKSDLTDQDFKTYVDENFQQVIPGALADLNNASLEVSLLQAFSRSNSIEITNVSLDDEHAIRIARCMRRDWMNARASLVDQWRNIEFVADQLEAGIDLVFEGDIGNDGDNPFRLRYETGQLRAGFRIDAPITRLAERNNYRSALIFYQQSRRQFYQFEDSIKQNLRQLIRNIGLNKVRFELDRRTVQIQIENVEINRFELERPVRPNATSSSLGATTAQNLTDAIVSLNGAQNSFISSWVNYEVLRRNLDFDLGTMLLDEQGQWLDPGQIDESIGVRAAAMMGFEPDCQFCENIGSSYLPPLPELEEEEEDAEGKDKTRSTGELDIFDIQRRRESGEGYRGNLTPQERQRIDLQLRELERQNELKRLELERQQRMLERPIESLDDPQIAPPTRPDVPELEFTPNQTQAIPLPTTVPSDSVLQASFLADSVEKTQARPPIQPLPAREIASQSVLEFRTTNKLKKNTRKLSSAKQAVISKATPQKEPQHPVTVKSQGANRVADPHREISDRAISPGSPHADQVGSSQGSFGSEITRRRAKAGSCRFANY